MRDALFPLGESRKQQVRAEAAGRGLAVAEKPDSHDICFIADGDTAGFLRARLGERPGTVVDVAGSVVGAHDGTYSFTVGQRRGLRLGVPASDGRPRFVLDIEPISRTVTVGPREALSVTAIEAVSPRWCAAVPTAPLLCTAQLRAHGEELPATATVLGERILIDLQQPASGIAPGQAAVLYDGTRVVGSGTIASATQ